MVTRRSLLKTTAGTGIAAAAAGCTGNLADGGEAPSCEPVAQEPNYEDWFDGVGTYRGTCDRRDSDPVTILVGAHGGMGYYRFVPTAIQVRPETTVRWEWSGKGGPHDVVAESGEFDSGDPVDSEDTTFEYTFETPGLYRYYCSPHRQMGMRGAVYTTPE